MRRLTLVEKQDLYSIVLEAIESGDYYGNKNLYYARLRRLLKWVEELPTKGGDA